MDALTADRVTEVLRRHLDPSAVCEALERGPIGNGQETWFLTVRSGVLPPSLVLRRTAEAGPLEWTDRAAEAAAMATAAAQGLPVPRVHHHTADPDELGAGYLVMDRAPGTSMMLARGDERRRLGHDLARQLARLHAAAVPDPLGRDAATATRDEVERWRRHYIEGRVAPVPIVDALLAWLDANVPDLGDQPAVLLWGDAGAHNTLGRDGAVSALLDWELAHAGHPLEDVASAMWIDEDGGIDPTGLLEAYEAAVGSPVDRDVISYFMVMMCVTRSVMITVGAAAFMDGRSHAPNLAGLGLDLPVVNLARAARYAGWGEAPDPDDPPPVAPAEVMRPTGAEIDTGVAEFLAADVLPQVTDPRTRRGLKTAVALLRTAALRARAEPAVAAAATAATRTLTEQLASRGVEGGLADAAARVEADPDLADLRPLVRRHLLEDLARRRGLIAPLHRLYHP